MSFDTYRTGNWVKYKGSNIPLKIRKIDLISIEDIEPIILTDDIIKKNGFIPYIYVRKNCEHSIILPEVNNYMCKEEISTVFPLRYVHEFQNFLSDCNQKIEVVL